MQWLRMDSNRGGCSIEEALFPGPIGGHSDGAWEETA